eukprot:16443992-Heterocapsa_arctica.AAC.1
MPQPPTIPLVTLPASAAAPATLMYLGAWYWRHAILASPGGNPWPLPLYRGQLSGSFRSICYNPGRRLPCSALLRAPLPLRLQARKPRPWLLLRVCHPRRRLAFCALPNVSLPGSWPPPRCDRPSGGVRSVFAPWVRPLLPLVARR